MCRIAKFFIMLFLFSLFPAPSIAAVYYSGNQTVYVRPDPYYQLGQTIGNIFGALIESNNRQEQERQLQELLTKIRTNFRQNAQSESRALAQAVEKVGVKDTMDFLSQAIYQAGHRFNVNNASGIIYLTYAFKASDHPDAPDVVHEYSINTNSQQCRMVIALPYFNISESGVSNYYITSPSQYTPSSHSSSSVSSKTNIASPDDLGIVFAKSKTADGGFCVEKIVSGGRAALAGIKTGDVLIKIDAHNLKEHDQSRLNSYIQMRIQQNASIAMTILRNGATKQIDVR